MLSAHHHHRYGLLAAEYVAPAGDEDASIRHGDLVTHAWRHSPGRVRTSLEDFLSVSGLSIREQQLLRERYRWDGDHD
ncbi:hypothetical protein [Nonomuraea sp. NPDC002799]